MSAESAAKRRPLPQTRRFISCQDIAREPFRIFFPAAVLTGLLAVALWPLHFSGAVTFYPGRPHAQLMVHGFLGGFILGVLGTGLPRMLSAPPFRLGEVLGIFSLYVIVILSNLAGRITYANIELLLLVAVFIMCAASRLINRKDVPPPGFVMVAMAFASLVIGTVIAITQAYAEEVPLFWINLERLLSFQGFVLLSILGVGGFMLPRFFGLQNQHSFAESRTPPPGWIRKATLGAATGFAIILSFVVEALGWERTGHAVRFLVSGTYLITQVPLYRSPIRQNTIRVCLTLAIGLMLAGYLTLAFYPVNKVAVLHFTLVGGFAVLTFAVATRVVFGHSGNQSLLSHRNRWLYVAVGLMVLGMSTRISGDFFPNVRVSHYTYGAAAWILGSLVWSVYVLPKVLIRDPDDA